MKKYITIVLCLVLATVCNAKQDEKSFDGKALKFKYPSTLNIVSKTETDSLVHVSLSSKAGSKVDVKYVTVSKGYSVSDYMDFYMQCSLGYLYQAVGENNMTAAKLQNNGGTENYEAIVGDRFAQGWKYSALYSGVAIYGKIVTVDPDNKHFVAVTMSACDSLLLRDYDIICKSINCEGISTFDPDRVILKCVELISPEEEMKNQTDIAVGAFDVRGNDDEGGTILKAIEPIGQQEVGENVIFDVVEQMPSFPGGQKALMDFLSSHVRYPAVAEENGIQGRVTVQFVVEKDGSITDVTTMKSVDPSLDREAERVIKSMPKWIPGKQNGKEIRVKYFVPIVFRIPEEEKRPDDRVLALSQDLLMNVDAVVYGEIEDKPDTKASFVGGAKALNEYISTNLVYPEHLKNFGIEDTIVIAFVVEKDGRLSNIDVESAKSQSLAGYAMKLVEAMPNWIPAKKAKENVRSWNSVTIEYKK